MEPKRISWSEQFFHPITKVVSGFRLGTGIFLIVFTVLLINYSIRAPVVEPMLQSFNSFGANSSVLSWAFSSSSTKDDSNSSPSSSASANSSLLNVGRIHEKGISLEANGSRKALDNSHLESSPGKVENQSLSIDDVVTLHRPVGANGSLAAANGTVLDSKSGELPFEITHLGNSSSQSLEKGNLVAAKEKKNETETEVSNNNLSNNASNRSLKNCDIFDGRWVSDDTKPYYPAGSCPYIDRDFDCHLNGRPDDRYIKWKWQPNGCDIPSLNATDFLERLRGKRLVFVGDSLNRNMWESLVCVLHHSIRNKKKVYEISGRKEFKKKGVYAFRFEDYNCSVDFVNSPFLVRESSFKGRNGSLETLRLDVMDQTTSTYRDADIIVFNTGHWWTHEKTSRGEDYYQEGNYVHPRLQVLEAYTKALKTLARWIKKNISRKRTQVFFRGYSVTHFRQGQWNSGGQCHNETEPIFNETYLASYPIKMTALENVLREVKTPITYMNISRLTDYRKDGHPSIYRVKYKDIEDHIQDCSHWCLPGVPDTWNELLYASLLKAGRGSWRN